MRGLNSAADRDIEVSRTSILKIVYLLASNCHQRRYVVPWMALYQGMMKNANQSIMAKNPHRAMRTS